MGGRQISRDVGTPKREFKIEGRRGALAGGTRRRDQKDILCHLTSVYILEFILFYSRYFVTLFYSVLFLFPFFVSSQGKRTFIHHIIVERQDNSTEKLSAQCVIPGHSDDKLKIQKRAVLPAGFQEQE